MFGIDTSEVVLVCFICGFLVAAIVWLISIARMKDLKRGLYLAESFLLIAIVLFLAAGTRKTILEIVESVRQERIVLPLNQNEAVLNAYRQLNEELSRWFVIFVVLGSFFGLVIPIGTYLLQIRAVVRKEDEFDARLKDEESRHRDEIERANSELSVVQKEQKTLKIDTDHAVCTISEMEQKFSNDVMSLWNAQSLMAYERIEDAIKDAEDDGWTYNKGCVKEFLRSILVCLKFLEKSGCENSIRTKIESIAKLIKLFSSKTIEVDCAKWTNGFTSHSSNGRIEIRKYCDQCVDSFETVRAFLRKFQIEVLDEKPV